MTRISLMLNNIAFSIIGAILLYPISRFGIAAYSGALLAYALGVGYVRFVCLRK